MSGEGLIDCVTHLDDERISASALRGVLDRAHGIGIACVLNAGTDPNTVTSTTRERLQTAAQESKVGLWEAFGLHPCFVRPDLDLEATMEALNLHLDAGAVAVGEIGLDARKTSPDPQLQLEAFDRQLALARERDLPVVFHVVRAWDGFFAAVDRHPGTRGVVHGFTGAPEVTRALFKRGLSISVGAAAQWPNSKRLGKTLASLNGDLSHLLVETDSPDHPAQDAEVGEPSNLLTVIDAVAQRCGVSASDVAMASTANAKALFAPS